MYSYKDIPFRVIEERDLVQLKRYLIFSLNG